MHMLTLAPGASPADMPAKAVVCHDVRDPAERSDILVRKGTLLQADQIAALLERPVTPLHLAVPAPDDLSEDVAAQRLAAAVAGPGVGYGPAGHGQVSLTSDRRGLLRVYSSRLDQVNAQPDVLLLTAQPDRAVEVDATLGVVKCAPVLLPERTLRAVEDVRTVSGPVLELIGFRQMRVAFVAPRERLRGAAFDRACAALSGALEWYGSSLEVVVGTDATCAALAGAYHQTLQAGVDLIMAAGAASTDPLDVVFEALRAAGGEVDQIGTPAEPGTACWIGHLGTSTPILGLASCELFGQPGALDLLLPRLLTGEKLDRQLLRGLALGGLLLGPSRIAPYHSRRHPVD